MSKIKKLTSDSAHDRILVIAESLDLPFQAAAALEIIAKIEKEYQTWKGENSDFVKKNKKDVEECQNNLNEIIAGYTEVEAARNNSTDLDSDCAVDGPIWDTMQCVNLRLDSFQARFNDLLTRAEDFVNIPDIEK